MSDSTPTPQKAAPKVQVPAHVAEILAPSLQVGLGAGEFFPLHSLYVEFMEERI